MTPLQSVLRAAYKQAWARRNRAASRVGELLFDLEMARNEVAGEQRWLESVAAELKASGYEKADDYLARIWPVACPPEQPSNPNGPVAE